MPSPPNSTAHSPAGPAKSPRKAQSGLRPALGVAAENTVRREAAARQRRGAAIPQTPAWRPTLGTLDAARPHATPLGSVGLWPRAIRERRCGGRHRSSEQRPRHRADGG
eukprot:scaffold49334_cov62-Phaeocystis_antarctica.AAC.2